VSPAFSNAADLTASLDSNFLYATLANPAVTGTYEFFYEAKTSTGQLLKQVLSLKFVVFDCTPSTIISSVVIVLKQVGMAGSSNTKYKIPVYENSASGCPLVTNHALYTKDCSTLSTDFKNAASLTVLNGYLYAELVNKIIPKTYEFCLKVSAS